jgi:hypothetical protein
MRAVCIARRGETLPEGYLDPRLNVKRETDFHLTVGQKYMIYAVAIRNQQVWYYVVDDDNLWFPIYKPAPLFSIVDDRVSRHWRVKLTPGNLNHEVLLAFEEWASDDQFYDRLSDKDQAAVRVFRERRQQMDEEFELQEPAAS